MIPESELESKPGLLESESWILENPGIGIRIGNSPCGIGIGIEITGPGIIYNSGYTHLMSNSYQYVIATSILHNRLGGNNDLPVGLKGCELFLSDRR